MAFLQGFDDKQVILRQGDKPNSLFLVSRGVCRVERAPHNTVRLGRDLQETMRQLEHLQTQYSFHHRLRNIVPASPPNGSRRIHPVTSLGQSVHRAVPDRCSPPVVFRLQYGRTTLTEVLRKELAMQIVAKQASLVELKQTQSVTRLLALPCSSARLPAWCL